MRRPTIGSIWFFGVLCLIETIRCFGAEPETVDLFSDGLRTSSPEKIVSVWDDLTDQIATPDDWAVRRNTLRREYLALIADDAKPEKPPLDLRWEEAVAVDGVYTRHKITYNVEADERATAYLGIPLEQAADEENRPQLFPAVVALHGTTELGMSQTAGLCGDWTKAHLDHLCRMGFVVIAPEHFVAENRIPPEGAYDTTAFHQKHPNWTAVGKFNYEHSIAVDVLETLEQVDSARIGVVGHSLGGHGSYFLAAYDERIAAGASNCGMGSFRQSNETKSWARDSWYVYFQTMRGPLADGILPNIDHHEIIALIAPRPFLDVSALNDGDPLAQRQRILMLMKVMDIYDLLGAPDAFSFYVHGSGHSIGTQSRALIYTWLKEKLSGGSQEPAKGE